MSEPNGNGKNGTVVGAAASVARVTIGALPSQFLMLVLLNLIFLGVVFWHENATALLRAEAINKMLDHCLVKEK